jgi:hypothetical protein
MANIIKEHRLIDSTKRTLAKYILISDGNQNANSVLLDVSTLAFALNANGYIMQSNTHPKSKYNTTIKRISGKVASSNGKVYLQWHGDSNSEIIVTGSGRFDFDFQSMGDGAVFTNPEANSSGDVLITTSGLVAGDAATIIIDVRKDNRDYDAGQSADPYAFNRG